MNIFSGKKKLISSLSIAFVFSSVAMLGVWLVSLLPVDIIRSSIHNFKLVDGFCFCAAFGGLASFYITDSAKQSLLVAFSIVVSSCVFYLFSGYAYSMVLAILLGVALSLIVKSIDLVYSTIAVVLLGIVIGVTLGILYQPFFDMLKSFCSTISGKPALFGAINNVYSIFVSHTFGDLFYHSDYSSAQLIDGEIVSGAVDIFFASGVPSSVVSKFLSAKYFVSIFLSIGVFVSLFNRINDDLRIALICITLASIISGDERLIGAFLVVYNPFVYLGYLVVVFLAYFFARFIDIRIGFVDSGSVVELFKYCHSWGYFLLTGAILAVLMYFVVQIVLSKFDFDNKRLLPRDVRRIVNALGGERNIQRIRCGKVYVQNPNLIDILQLDCDIHENEITLIQNDLDLLQEFF